MELDLIWDLPYNKKWNKSRKDHLIIATDHKTKYKTNSLNKFQSIYFFLLFWFWTIKPVQRPYSRHYSVYVNMCVCVHIGIIKIELYVLDKERN